MNAIFTLEYTNFFGRKFMYTLIYSIDFNSLFKLQNEIRFYTYYQSANSGLSISSSLKSTLSAHYHESRKPNTFSYLTLLTFMYFVIQIDTNNMFQYRLKLIDHNVQNKYIANNHFLLCTKLLLSFYICLIAHNIFSFKIQC